MRRPAWYYHYFSGVAGLGVGAEDELDRALAWLRQRGVAGRLRVSPLDADERLLGGLVERGLRPDGFMTVLWGRPRPDSATPPAGVEVWACERDGLGPFLEVYCAGAPAELGEKARALVASELRDWRCYVALADGRAVASAALFVGGRAAVMAAASTLPEFRGRGVQTALLRRRIADAHALGCDLVVCQAAPGSTSQRNQERVGLRTAYTLATWVDAAPVA